MTEQATILASRLPEHHNKLLAAYLYIYLYTYKRGISRVSTRPVFGCWLLAVGCLRKLASLQGVGGPTGAACSRRRGHGRAGKRSGPLWRGQISPASKQGAGGGCLSPRLPLRPVRLVRTREVQKPARFLVAGTAKASADRREGRMEARRGRDAAGGSMRSTTARPEGRRPAATRCELDDAGQPHRHRTKAT